ncbi:MAG: TonB-dependent receptor [Chlorobi bacterium]|nr:TonB-dependent receptor [Chlorobiota bacterium]
MKKHLLLFWMVLVSFVAAAQDRGSVKGIVVDAATGTPLEGVTVSVEGDTRKTTTDAEGRFFFEELPAGNLILVFEKDGYERLVWPVQVAAGRTTDMGRMEMWKTGETEDIGLINIDEQELESGEETAETISGILHSGQDAFSRAASFQFSNARFSMRGLDTKYSTVYLNGIPFNELYNGRPQWSSWGGLNDVMRARELFPGLMSSDYGIGGPLGAVNYNIKASDIRPTKRISYAVTNRSYRHRLMGTYATGINKNGWAFAALASVRYAKEGYFEGTFYNAKSLFLAAEKRLNDNHGLNLTVFFTPNMRGKSSPNTMEVYGYKGPRYNAYWGYQEDKKRNARIRKLCAPTVIFTHDWKIDQNTALQTSLAFRQLKNANSRIGYYNANNPDPTYYRYLPSYWLSRQNVTEAIYRYLEFKADGQIDWEALYRANLQNTADDGSARYYWYDDVNKDRNFYFNTHLTKRVKENIVVNAALNYRHFRSEGYAMMNDLLGAPFFYDKNPYAPAGLEDNDLRNPDRKVLAGDKFSYDYFIHGQKGDGFVQAQYFSKYLDIRGAAEAGFTAYQREGLFQNPLFDDSYGLSPQVKFNTWGFKAGATFKITGRHLLDVNFLRQSRAPDMRNVFYNSRVSGDITPGISNEEVTAMDVSYFYRSPYFKSRLTAYIQRVDNYTEIHRFFAQGISLNGVEGIPADVNGNAFFLTQMVTGENRYYEGIEWGMEAQVAPEWKVTAALAAGKHIYANDPDVYVASDLFDATYLGTSYLAGYRLANGPQQAASVGVEYRSPKYWFAGVNFNYFNHSYINISPLLRTSRFYTDPATNEPYGAIENYRGVDAWDIPAVTPEILAELLEQEKIRSYTHVNLIGGKSWKVDDYYIGLFVLVNNLFDSVNPTGGFEQSRKASYPELYVDKKINPIPVFGNKYWMSYGRNYFLMLSVRF